MNNKQNGLKQSKWKIIHPPPNYNNNPSCNNIPSYNNNSDYNNTTIKNLTVQYMKSKQLHWIFFTHLIKM